MTSFQRTGHRERLTISPNLDFVGVRIRVASRGQALVLLRELGHDAWGMAALRRVYAEAVGRTSICWEGDRAVLEELAQRLTSGALKAHAVELPAPRVPAFALLPVSEAVQPKPPPPKPKKWFEIELVDDGDPPSPMAGAKFRVELPDGRVIEGQLDDAGKAKIEAVELSECKITFPDFDDKEWAQK